MKDREIPKLFFDKFDIETQKKWLPDQANITGICACCGKNVDLIPRKKIIKPTFPEKDIFKGEGFCKACAFFILNRDFRTHSFVLKKDPVFISHAEVWKILLSELDPPYVISLKSPNFRRFNILYCRTNFTRSARRVITYDQQEIVFDLIKDKILFDTVDEIYNQQNQVKEAIRKRNYNVSKISDNEYRELMRLDNILTPYRATALLDLIIDFCQKKEV